MRHAGLSGRERFTDRPSLIFPHLSFGCVSEIYQEAL